MDIMVNHVTGLSNINQFLMRFIRATSTMEQTFLKLFKIHVLLTEDSYVDTEHGDPPMAITYSIQDSNHNAGSELTVVAENSGYHCLQPSVSWHSKVLGSIALTHCMPFSVFWYKAVTGIRGTRKVC